MIETKRVSFINPFKAGASVAGFKRNSSLSFDEFFWSL
jgi:hypothetical protein